MMIDVGEEGFEREVIERSRQMPVVVDFWAPWCAPCRTLGPVLERLAAERDGTLTLAKVNVDEAPSLADAFRIQSIPMVKAFRDGSVVAEFVGAQPEHAVRAFIESVLPREAELLAREADCLVAAGEAAAAESRFQDALARDAREPRALLGLARLYGSAGREAEALDLLERLSVSSPLAREGERLAAELRTRMGAAGDEATLRARLAAVSDDPEARLALGRLLSAAGQHEEALAELLEGVRRDPSFADEAARKAMLDVFEVLGPRHPVTERYRGELAKALFR